MTNSADASRQASAPHDASVSAAHPLRDALLVVGSLPLLYQALTSSIVNRWLRNPFMLDLAVYQAGGRAIAARTPLYTEPFVVRPDLPAIPFTYPPFAAALLTR